MAGNSARRGAIKKTGKGNPTAGSGGRRRQGLEGKGPTPKAKDREGHKDYKSRKKAESAAAKRPQRRTPKTGDSEWVAGRNSVVEALRAHLPITTLYVAEGAERDGRPCRARNRVAGEGGGGAAELRPWYRPSGPSPRDASGEFADVRVGRSCWPFASAAARTLASQRPRHRGRHLTRSQRHEASDGPRRTGSFGTCRSLAPVAVDGWWL